VHYWVADAKDFLANNTHLFSDVYFFPKSLSEFSDMDLNAIVNVFSSKKIQKTNFLSVYRSEKIREVWRWIYRDQNV